MSTYSADRLAYDKRYRLDRSRGVDRSRIPVDTVASHLAWLQECGLSLRSIADTTGIHCQVITNLRHRRNPTTERATARRVLAVTPSDVYRRPNADGFVPKIGATRRIHALYAIGWTAAHINDATGKHRGFAQAILNQPGDWITLNSWQAITGAYDHLSMTPGPSTINRGRATKHGWVPPLAWDDATIDDPSATPCTGDDLITPQDRESNRGRGRVNPDALHDCITEWGMTLRQTADRLHVTRATVEQAIGRLDPEQRDTLREQARRNATIHAHGDAA